MPHPQAKVHRMSELVEPIATAAFCQVVTEAFLALGMRNYWDGYFAGRAAPLGLAPAEVVHAVFYNLADGEVARHIPWVWRRTTPKEAIAVRERGSVAALRQRIGDHRRVHRRRSRVRGAERGAHRRARGSGVRRTQRGRA